VKEKFHIYKNKFYGFSTPVRLSFIAGALLVCAIIITFINSRNADQRPLTIPILSFSEHSCVFPADSP